MMRRKLLSPYERQRLLSVPDDKPDPALYFVSADRLETEVLSEADEFTAFRHRSWSQGITLIPDLHGPTLRHRTGDSCPRRAFAVLARSRGSTGSLAGHGPGRL